MKSSLVWSENIKNADNSIPPIYSVAFSTDEKYLFATAANQVLVYDVENGKLIQTLKGHKDTVTCVTALANGGLASGGADKTVILWSPKFEGVLKYSHSYSIQALEQDPLSQVLVSCTAGDFGLWSAEKKAVTKTKVSSRVLSISWAKDGQHFALGMFDGAISIRNKFGDERAVINRGCDPVWSLSWTILQDTDVLTTSSWDKKISFYDLDGKQVGRDREIGYNACTLRHTPTGDFFLIGGSDKKLTLWTAEGVKLNTIFDARGWVWSSQMRSKQNQIAVGTQDGTISIYQINFHTIHGLYQDKYAFRQNMTEVVIQDLSTDQRTRLRCRDYVQKIAIYKENLAVQLSDRVIIYEMSLNGYGEMHYRIKEKVQQIFDCNLLVVSSQSLIVCHGTQIRMYSFSGKLEREWSFDVLIRYIKVIGGPVGKESVLIGLKSGTISQIFLNNPFPIQLLEQKNPIRCLDLSMARTKLAIVDDKNTCLVYDMHTKELLYSEPNANSVSWNTVFDDMLCFSGNGLINIKIANFPVFSQNLDGFVVGFKGSRVYCLNKYSMISLDVSFSSSIESFVERRDFDSAYRVACLGATQSDWSKLGMSALEYCKLGVAKKAFIRLKETKYFEIIRQMEKSKNNSEYEILWGEVNALAGSYNEAAKIFIKCGQIEKAIDMYTDLNMWDAATAIAQANPSKNVEILRKKAQLQKDRNDLEAAANTYIEIEDYLSAIEILGENGWFDKLIGLSRHLTKAHHNEIKSCVEWFKQAGKPEFVIETLRKMGDISQLIQYYIQLKQWDEAFTVIEMHPEFGEKLYLPYADWLAAQSRYSEAQEFYHKAGEWDSAIRVLKELASASVVEKRFDDASKYFLALESEISIKCSKEAKKGASHSLDMHKYHQWSQIYYAYHFVYSYIEEPFSSQLSSNLFFMARYIYHCSLKNSIPPGISMCHVLFSLGRLGKILGGYKVSQFCFEKLLNLYYPNEWEHIIESSLLTLQGKPKTDSEEVCRRCYACGSTNPPLNPVAGDECTICHEPFIHSFYSLDDLPLVKFTFCKSLDANFALSLLKTEPLAGSKSLDTLISSLQSKKIPGSPLNLDEATLSSLDPHQVFFANDQGGILCADSLLKVATCSKCQQFFLDEEWQFCASCPFFEKDYEIKACRYPYIRMPEAKEWLGIFCRGFEMDAMFYKQNIQLPILKGAFFPPDKAAEFLLRASAISVKSGFTWVFVDRPSGILKSLIVDGSMFVYKVNTGDVGIPDDGYGWMDDEVFSKVTVGNHEIEVISRSQGFSMGDTVVSMTRRRYRLSGNPDFQLLHYTSISSESQRIPIAPSKIRNWPRDPALLQKLARGEESLQVKKKFKKQNSQVRIQENVSTENLGDELDGSINRIVSTERYKRNHIFIDLIFSPFTAESMKSNFKKSEKEDVTKLKSEISDLESEISHLEAKFKNDKQELFSGKTLHHDLDEISRISELGQIDGFLGKWSTAWKRNLRWRRSLVVERSVGQA